MAIITFLNCLRDVSEGVDGVLDLMGLAVEKFEVNKRLNWTVK